MGLAMGEATQRIPMTFVSVTPLHLDDPYVLEAVFVPVPQQPLRTMQTAQLRR